MIIGHDKRRSRATLGRDGIALILGNTIQSTLLEVWVVSPEQTSKLSPLFNYLEVAWVEESYPPATTHQCLRTVREMALWS